MWDEYVESEICNLRYGSYFCINDLPSLDEVKKRDCHLNESRWRGRWWYDNWLG